MHLRQYELIQALNSLQLSLLVFLAYYSSLLLSSFSQ